jgi:hypothetical protein
MAEGAIQRAFEKACSGICEGCPNLDEIDDNDFEHGHDEDCEGDHDLEDADPEIVKMAADLWRAVRIGATALMKEEVGCRGPYLCSGCVELHCGAERDIAPDLEINSSKKKLDY